METKADAQDMFNEYNSSLSKWKPTDHLENMLGCRESIAINKLACFLLKKLKEKLGYPRYTHNQAYEDSGYKQAINEVATFLEKHT